MTTAHRPTWKAAVGRSDEGGWSAGGARSAAVSALDAPAHKSLKFRGQVADRKAVIQKSLMELEQAERKRNNLPRRPLDAKVEKRAQLKLLAHTSEVDVAAIKSKYDDSDVDRGGGSDDDDADSIKSKGDKEEDESDLDDSDDHGSGSSDSDDDEDEEALLQAELAKIRAEREQAQKKAQEELDREEQARQEEAALLGNPLLNPGASRSGLQAAAAGTGAKRRWNEDVVFRNQARGEPAAKKRFINDTVRNDFHKRFLNKFIR
jgi:protein CWC15